MKTYKKEDIEALLHMVEVAVQRKMITSSDFELLANVIAQRCRSKVSTSTLKRLWGYDKNKHRPLFNTLSSLSKFIGFKDFKDFLDKKNLKTPTSFSYTASSVSSKDMHPGDELWITWAPNRRCQLIYQGFHRFKVNMAHNTKLHVGDSFSSMHFAEGMPLFLDNYIHKDNPPVTFVVGYDGGLNSVKHISSIEREDI